MDGCQPYSEDLWKTIKINKLTFLGVKLCGCCKVPTINQDNGIPSATERTETLLKFRSDEVLRPSHKNKRQVYFGQNLVCKESLTVNGKGKIINVGDQFMFCSYSLLLTKCQPESGLCNKCFSVFPKRLGSRCIVLPFRLPPPPSYSVSLSRCSEVVALGLARQMRMAGAAHVH